jgi:hypothetical protein
MNEAHARAVAEICEAIADYERVTNAKPTGMYTEIHAWQLRNGDKLWWGGKWLDVYRVVLIDDCIHLSIGVNRTYGIVVPREAIVKTDEIPF